MKRWTPALLCLVLGACSEEATPLPDLGQSPGPVDGGSGSGGGGQTGDLSSGGGPADLATLSPNGNWPAASTALEDEILTLVNQRRALGANCGTKGTFPAAGPLMLDADLRTAARLHSLDMATQNYFSHTGKNGSSAAQRMMAAGFNGSTYGENIAAGNATAAATMQQWMESDGHCANIMKASYKFLGVGHAYSASSMFKHYWTQNFGG
jgi:uncharacterized protein YkwD